MGRVVIDHRIMGGVPRVRGTRIPVATVLGEGLLTEEVLTRYPQPTRVDVLACVRYAADVLDRRTLPLHRQ